MLNDLLYAFRQLVKTPGFTVVAAFSLALGVAANTTIFSALDALVYRPLPYKDPDRLVVIWETNLKQRGGIQPPSVADVEDWQRQNHVFEDIASVSGIGGAEPQTLTDAKGAERVAIQETSPNLFALLRVKPALGRIPIVEDRRGPGQTVVISDSFWRRRFDASPDVLGRAFNIEGTDCRVVGVMPPGLSRVLDEKTAVWMQVPTAIGPYSKRTDHNFTAIGRLKPGVTLQRAQAEMEVIAARLEQAHPETNKDRGAKVLRLHEDLSGWARGILYPLFGAVSFVLLIACSNVANLILVRTEARR